MYKVDIFNTFDGAWFYWQMRNTHNGRSYVIFSEKHFKTKEEAHKDLVLTLKKLLTQTKAMEI